MGPEGPAGQKGDKGDKGDDGNANVRSTGWVTITADKWRSISSSGSTDLTAPGDLARFAVGSWAPLNGNESEGGVFVYVEDGRGSRLCPFQRTVTGAGKTGVLEFRVVYSSNQDFAQWLSPVVALKSGEWDNNYITNNYLPSLKWKAVIIAPQAMASVNHINFINYKQAQKALQLPD